MLVADAPHILPRAIKLAITTADSLSQAFLLATTGNVVTKADINEQNKTTDGVGDLNFDHGLSY